MGRLWRSWIPVALVLWFSLVLAAPAAGAAPVPLLPYAEALGIPRGWIKDVKVTGSPEASGVFKAPLAGFPLEGDRFLILSTGRAADAYLPDTNNAEVLSQGIAFDDMSTRLIGKTGNGTQDLVQLQLSLHVPGWAKSFAFDYAFFTEEWPDFFGSPFNDTFVAQIGDPVISVRRGGNVVAPGNLAFDKNGHLISVNVGFGLDPAQPNPNTGTAFDGTTGVLTTVAPIPSGMSTLTVTFSLFDVGDPLVDSAIFLDNFRFLKDELPAPITHPGNPGDGSSTNQDFRGVVTGGGNIGGGTEHSSFGGSIMDRGTPRGQWEHVSRDGDVTFHSSTITSVTFSTTPDGTSAATIEGTGELDGIADCTFTVWVTDAGEPGDADTYRIQIRSGSVILLDEAGTLTDGNIQVHPPDSE